MSRARTASAIAMMACDWGSLEASPAFRYPSQSAATIRFTFDAGPGLHGGKSAPFEIKDLAGRRAR
jgi:hypothetical protein